MGILLTALVTLLSTIYSHTLLPECSLKAPEWMTAKFAQTCPQARALFGSSHPESPVEYEFPVVGINSKGMLMYGNQELGIVASFYYNTPQVIGLGAKGTFPDSIPGLWVFHQVEHERAPPNILAILQADRVRFSFMPPNRAKWFICGEEKEIDFHCEVKRDEAVFHPRELESIPGAAKGREPHFYGERLSCGPKESLPLASLLMYMDVTISQAHADVSSLSLEGIAVALQSQISAGWLTKTTTVVVSQGQL
uniref:DUF985 domain-containing protein n=1 Tax=Chromera velia CCMP2878 TaxID=1169474 RepID=A0A0G4FIN3_9ALVE|eukprot:Cvel_17202.t1-p1 / transcript=Cvel_17202.t1 / gene=Cvel_17202 / organism=Chromera_velia_CCMP2878 / gene_product=hypothetical protein / transcript_product=hypothetical protein / location=Cvel_scaffold1360:15135-17344(+) / protein_length=251 / sequence_SO=supercontig / SO=protein_coding / is_pseudo=false